MDIGWSQLAMMIRDARTDDELRRALLAMDVAVRMTLESLPPQEVEERPVPGPSQTGSGV